jgi:hypothetical protein
VRRSVILSFEAALIQDDAAAVAQCEDGGRWTLVLAGPLDVWVTLRPSTAPAESFQARLLWTKYPDDPPSLLFRDPDTGRLDVPGAWPVAGPVRPMIGLCVSYTKEGFALHPEWAGDPTCRWAPFGNVLLKVIRSLQEDLDTSYTGRFQG